MNTEQATDAIGRVVTRTNSELILFFSLVAIVVVATCIPLFKIISSSGTKKRDQYFKREQLLIRVIQENAQASAKLSTVLETMNNSCEACRNQQLAMIQLVLDKQEATLLAITQLIVAVESKEGSEEDVHK